MEKELVKRNWPKALNRFFAASKLDAENNIRLKVNNKNNTVKKYFLIEITIKRIIPSIILIYMHEKLK